MNEIQYSVAVLQNPSCLVVFCVFTNQQIYVECCELLLEFSTPHVEQFSRYAAKLSKW